VWLWFVLGGLLILIAWALKYTLDYPMLWPILATVGVIVLVGLIWLAKYILAYRAAKRLQDAIEQQGTQQAMNARPERRAEIQELRKQLLGGLSAIKKSKLGRGQQRGGAALYTMPWYMIIGPPGAGKTTALTHSGLVFPYGSSTGGGIRGVGGTRNCDWWFTNEAILLDTAGRYTTESDDRDEWISFLTFLRRYRPKRPINGIIIALSISELIDASEMQIEAVGQKLRARIDEVATQLHMVLPVYLLFTKVDLIAGFSEFFNDMKKSDRSKCWGATIKLELPKNEPARVFGAEFDVLVKQLHARALKRCVMERGREVREKLYQFPLEFSGLKKNLADLIGITFQPNNIQGTPIFRGFYFTSGTQEGRPMDRVLERMSAAMGIRAHSSPQQQQQQQQQQPIIESKSYFLHDVFMTVIFPDGDIAVRSASEERRRALMKVAIAGATFALAAILAFPAVSSYLNNQTFLKEAERRSQETATIDWTDDNVDKRFRDRMVPTLDHLKEHDKFEKQGIPFGMGWGMFVADKVKRPTLRVYAAQMETGFALPCKRALEERLRTADGKFYLKDRTTLRMYLMLSSFGGKMDHLDVEWATGRYTQLWAELMAPTTNVSPGELKLLARPHVQYYLELIKKNKVTPVELDEEAITKARYVLQTVGLEQRYYDMLVNAVGEERIDNANDPTINNLVFPPMELPRVFPSRTNEVLRFIQSKLFLATKKNHQVAGQYTAKGYAAVLRQLEVSEGLMKNEAWVVPLSAEETSDKIPRYVTVVKKRYEEEYIKAWLDFFADIQAKVPTSPDEAIEVYREISTVVYPLGSLLTVLEENTQWKDGDPFAVTDEASGEIYRPFLQRIERYRQDLTIQPEIALAAKRTDVIPKKFESATKFAGAVGNDSRVYRYAELIVKKLKDEVIAQRNVKKENFALSEMSTQIDAARAAAEALLSGFDATAVTMLKNILLDPLKIGERKPLGQGVDPNVIQNQPGPPKPNQTPLFNRPLPTYKPLPPR